MSAHMRATSVAQITPPTSSPMISIACVVRVWHLHCPLDVKATLLSGGFMLVIFVFACKWVGWHRVLRHSLWLARGRQGYSL